VTLNSAAKRWLAAKAAIAEHQAELDAAKVVLLEHFRSSGSCEHRGVRYARSSLRALDVGLARAALGPRRAEECTVERTRETLSAAA